ncbi:hypothetical protein RJ640_018849, partial [Escallonia rubra]
EWDLNQNGMKPFYFLFGGVSELPIKIAILVPRTISWERFAESPLEPLFMEGSVPPTSYNVVKDEEYCGE